MWQPTAPLSHLRLRAQLLSQIRQFFVERQVLEVETPLLSQHTVTDQYIDSFKTTYRNGNDEQAYYLQTSPEYAMKRLLAAGSGSIFQITKAFRNGEIGNQHNPEFSLLEWYRVGFNHHDLMDEVDALLQHVMGTTQAERISYQALFMHTLNIDPQDCELSALLAAIKSHKIHVSPSVQDKDTLLQLLLTHLIEPTLGIKAPLFLYDFPATQAALARIHNGVAARFEVYIAGMELANGFHELTNAEEQLHRFHTDQHHRKCCNKEVPNIDQRLISALQHGLPDCAGVALGLDRLLTLLTKTTHIKNILSFSWEHA